MVFRSATLAVAAAVLLTACATIPSGPNVMVLPGSGKNFEQFQSDDAICRQWAAQQTGGMAQQTSTDSTVGGAVVGTVVGAALGAAIGAAAGSPATGAAVGAGAGLLGGTAVGASNAAQGGSASVQRRYDMSYMQCMYAKGNQIPVARGSQPPYASQAAPPPPPPPPAAGPKIPPPPAGTPPSAPPGPSR